MLSLGVAVAAFLLIYAGILMVPLTTTPQEPELNKAMVLLLARCWEYKLKTEDVLELTQVGWDE